MKTAPHYTLIETSVGNDPAVVVVNASLRKPENREGYPWHLRVEVDCRSVGSRGMPTPSETKILEQTEGEIASAVSGGNNALFLARITRRGQQILLFRVCDSELAHDRLQQLVLAPSPRREWSYEMTFDRDWTLAEPELQLLEKDRRMN